MAISQLKLFNERTFALVLGAGAMRLHKLKSITAKHLALAQQSLELIAYDRDVTKVLALTRAHCCSATFPSLRRRLQTHLRGERALLLTAFDAVVADYDAHRIAVGQKLATVMADRVAQYVVELGASIPMTMTTTATATTTATTATASEPMHRLINELASFQRTLARTLDEQALSSALLLTWQSVLPRLRAACQASLPADNAFYLDDDERLAAQALQRQRVDVLRRLARHDALIFVDAALRFYARDAQPPLLVETRVALYDQLVAAATPTPTPK